MRSSADVRVGLVAAILLAAFTTWVLGAGCSSQQQQTAAGGDAATAKTGMAPAALTTYLPTDPDPEFRGVFVTSAYNLDWPSKPGLHWRAQRDEINEIVDRVAEMNCNVIILQVRAFGDRMHRKAGNGNRDAEPWAEAVNHGNQDPHPNKKYDPLAEWIHAAHSRGIELHLWVNPFRVDGNVKYKGKDLDLFPSADGLHVYLHPNSQDVQDYVIDVVQELIGYKDKDTMALRERDGEGSPAQAGGALAALMLLMDGDGGPDGVLIDHDLPSGGGGGGGVPPTQPSTRPLGVAEPARDVLADAVADAEGSAAALAALLQVTPTVTPTAAMLKSAKDKQKDRIKWIVKKRHGSIYVPPAVNPAKMTDFIKALFNTCNNAGVKLGLSPLKQDGQMKQWLTDGWAHYVAPELYLRMTGPKAPDVFNGWLNDWLNANTFLDPAVTDKRKPIIVPALYSTGVQSPAPAEDIAWGADEITSQITLARTKTGTMSGDKSKGQTFYSWSALRSPPAGGPGSSNNLGDKLKEVRPSPQVNYYTFPVRIPPMQAGVPCDPPVVNLNAGNATWSVTDVVAAKKVRFWAVWLEENGAWGPLRIYPAWVKAIPLPGTVTAVAVKAIDGMDRASDFGRN